MINYKVGDRVEHWPFNCQEASRIVIIQAKHSNVKNNRSGFDGYTADDRQLTVWGYDSEVKQVLAVK